MALFAKAGHEIRDADGALIATLSRDVFEGEHVMASAFRLPNGEHPKPGDPMPRPVWDFVNRAR